MILKNKKPKILFRVSGGRVKNKQMGLGHVFRCINLAKVLQKDVTIYFLIEDYGGVKNILIKYGFKNIFELKKGLNLDLDINLTSQHIMKKNIDVLIIDRYNVKIKYVKHLKKITKTVIITDLKKIDYPANLIINGFIGFQNKKIKNKYNNNCLIGPAYQILNNQFNKKLKNYKKQKIVLATFGGLDEKGIADIFLNSLTKHITKMKIRLILGPIAKNSIKSNSFRKKNTKSIKIIRETKNMQKEISNSKFGFCGGGMTTYEFASMGVPFAIICDDKHQLITAREWEKKGIAKNLGLVGNNTYRKIIKILDAISENKIPYRNRKRKFVDGLGSKRVAHEILKMC